MNSSPQNDRDSDLAALFAHAKSIEVSPSPFLATRVLAELRSRRTQARKLFVWRFSAISSSLALAIFSAYLFITPNRPPEFAARIGKPHVVRVSLAELNSQKSLRAQVILPDGLYFFSEGFPEIRKQREFTFTWKQGENNATRTSLPFVVQSEAQGTKQVKVRFYDDSNALIAERAISIHFTQAGS